MEHGNRLRGQHESRTPLMTHEHLDGLEHAQPDGGSAGREDVDAPAVPEFAHLQARLDEVELRLAALELALGVGERQAAMARHVRHDGSPGSGLLEIPVLAGRAA